MNHLDLPHIFLTFQNENERCIKSPKCYRQEKNPFPNTFFIKKFTILTRPPTNFIKISNPTQENPQKISENELKLQKITHKEIYQTNKYSISQKLFTTKLAKREAHFVCLIKVAMASNINLQLQYMCCFISPNSHY